MIVLIKLEKSLLKALIGAIDHKSARKKKNIIGDMINICKLYTLGITPPASVI